MKELGLQFAPQAVTWKVDWGVLWVEFCPPKKYTEILTCERDLI